MTLTLEAQNFLGLRKIRWTLPRGVCALVGPNGAGKSTLLRLPLFLRVALEQGIGSATGYVGGPATLRHFDAPAEEPVRVGISVGELRWSLRLLSTPTTVDCEDRLSLGEDELVRREPFAPQAFFRGKTPLNTQTGGPALRALLATPVDGTDVLAPLTHVLKNWQVYEEQSYSLAQLRQSTAAGFGDVQINPQGFNAFAVLRNWRDSRATKPRWEFVLGSLREMFPDLFEDIEFVNAAHQMTARIIRPGRQDAVPVHLAPNGWLVGLLHLCALASTEPGGVVALDEPENALHPYAIRRLMDALAAWSEPRKITVILATHSPVILNQFDQSPERLFVMQPGEAVLPVALDALRDPRLAAELRDR